LNKLLVANLLTTFSCENKFGLHNCTTQRFTALPGQHCLWYGEWSHVLDHNTVSCTYLIL